MALNVKDMLIKPTSIPRNLELSMPQSMPKVSQIMTDMANSVPDLPDFPLKGESFSQAMNKIPDVVKGLEESLPDQAPKMVTGSGFRGFEMSKPKLPDVQGILGAGYRSIS